MSVTKDTIIMDVLRMDEGTAKFFFEIGLHCIGCPSASGESIEEAAIVHGVDANELWADIAIQPTKSINFIYVPIRIQKTS